MLGKDIAEIRALMRQKLEGRLKGGPGSGHFSHSGRPGHRGGSLPGTAGGPGQSIRNDARAKANATGSKPAAASTDKVIANQVKTGLERGHFLNSQAGKVVSMAEAIRKISPDKSKIAAVGEASMIVGEIGSIGKYIEFFQEELGGKVTVRQRIGLERELERLEAVRSALEKD